jgi:uncharacterized protein
VNQTPAHHPKTPVLLANAGSLPGAGVGFKPQHFDDILSDSRPIGFVEVHAENYLGAGGRPHAQLRALRERFGLSIHGVGLSIGGSGPLDVVHLERIARLVERYEPMLFSEHLAWSSHGGRFFNDLLPIAYDVPTLSRVCDHIDQIQSRLGRRMLLENPSTYLEFADNSFDEPQFLNEIVRRTGCGLLLDINNVHVSCFNHGHDALTYIETLRMDAVGEIHLAGHAEERVGLIDPILIDSHGATVNARVWSLYSCAVSLTHRVPTLIEWDTDVPQYRVLRAEAKRAEAVMDLVCNALSGQAA